VLQSEIGVHPLREARAFICGCAGLSFSQDERNFIRRFAPWGLILFARNIDSISQVTALTHEFREILGRTDAPVLVDQEGGRVQRMRPPVWRSYPSAAAFLQAPEAHRAGLVRAGARLIASELAEVGISVDCLPVLDVPAPGGHDVIGDRAYSNDAASVAQLGRAACEGLLAGGVLPVLKHIPGHGRAGADSHLALPVVNATRAELAADFAPFRALADMPLAMSAHVVYSAIDPDLPATLSPIVVSQVIRGEIGFDGLVMSDDLSMKALSGSFTEKTEALFAAGLDMALYCWSDLADAEAVASASPFLDGRRGERAAAALALLRKPEPFDTAAADAALAPLLAPPVS
jgi:beta-N-acetylhexosaminidase